MIKIYTDGAYSQTRGVGAYAFCAINIDGDGRRWMIHDDAAAFVGTTNQRMEIMAATYGLRWARENMPHKQVALVSDSKYVLGIRDWSKRWIRNGWRTANGDPVKNQDLIETYVEEISMANDLLMFWTKGHDTNEWNNYVDELATSAAEEAYNLGAYDVDLEVIFENEVK